MQIGDLKFEGIDPAEPLEFPVGKAQEASPLRECKSKRAFAFNHGLPAWADCRTIAPGGH